MPVESDQQLADDPLLQVAAENGYNFLPWNVPANKGLLVYRNLVTRQFFDGDIGRVPMLDGSNPINVLLHQAQNYMPDGIWVTI